MVFVVGVVDSGRLIARQVGDSHLSFDEGRGGYLPDCLGSDYAMGCEIMVGGAGLEFK